MATPPARTELADTYPLPSNATMRTGIGKLYDYVTGLLGATGDAAEARAALGVDVQHGQCILSKSGVNLLLSPRNGNKLMIDGVQYAIPSAGVSLAPTGLLATTLYYIYAYMGGATMTLEASTTTHTTGTATGVEIKSGDATRTLVGMAYVKTAATFADSATQRFVRSWFNDYGVTAANGFSTDRISAVTAGFAVIDSEILTEFVTWAGEAVALKASGGMANSGANVNRTGISVDSSTVAKQGASAVTIPLGAGASQAVVRDEVGLAEGYHYSYLLGYVSGGTGTWTGGNPFGWVLGATLGGRR